MVVVGVLDWLYYVVLGGKCWLICVWFIFLDVYDYNWSFGYYSVVNVFLYEWEFWFGSSCYCFCFGLGGFDDGCYVCYFVFYLYVYVVNEWYVEGYCFEYFVGGCYWVVSVEVVFG